MRRWLSIIGIGEDGVDGLGAHARRLIGEATMTVGGGRHLALAESLVTGEALAWRSPIEATMPEILARRGKPVVVLASGDPFFYGVGALLMTQFAADEMLCLPQPSSFSLAAARLGWALQEAALVSLHGRPLERIIRHLRHGARILALAWDGGTAARLAALLTERGFGDSMLHVMEALGGPNERRASVRALEYRLGATHALTVLGIDCMAGATARSLPLAAGLPDDWFEHDGQLTRRELRAVALAALRPQPGQLLWDIGGGAGSIAIEWLLRHETMQAVTIERDAERCARIARNAVALGVPELQVIQAEASTVLTTLAAPDAIFIGGGTSDAALMQACWSALKPGGVLVAHAVTLEGAEAITRLSAEWGGEVLRVLTERLHPVGRYRAFKPSMPVTHWAATKTSAFS